MSRPNPSLTLKHTGNASFTNHVTYDTKQMYDDRKKQIPYHIIPWKGSMWYKTSITLLKIHIWKGNPFLFQVKRKKYILPIRSQKKHQNLWNMSGSQFPHNATVGQAMYRLSKHFSFPFSSHFSLVCFHLDSKSSFCCSHYKWRSSEKTDLPYEEIITKITSTWHEYQLLEILIGCECWTCYSRLNSPLYLVMVGANKKTLSFWSARQEISQWTLTL